MEIFRRWYRDSVILDNYRNQAASYSMAVLCWMEVCFIPFIFGGVYFLLIGRDHRRRRVIAGLGARNELCDAPFRAPIFSRMMEYSFGESRTSGCL